MVQAKTLEKLEALAPSMKGKIVRLGVLPQPEIDSREKADRRAYHHQRQQLTGSLKAAAVLRSSGRDSDLQNMCGASNPRQRRPAAPTTFLSGEQADMLERMVKRGRHPQIELQIGGTLSSERAQTHNAVAEIPGGQWPEEVVIVRANLDSTDNGTGAVAAMEVLRAIQDPVDYMKTTHHSQADTFTHVIPADLIQDTQALAATARGFLNMPERVPHMEAAKPEGH